MKTVLYAEDSEDDAFFMSRAFRKVAAESELFIVENGEAAIEYLSRPENPTPCLVFLDLKMPLRNGFEVLEWIRNRPESASLPVFVLTSSNHEGDRDRANALGANGYLVKPSQPEKLSELIQSCKTYWL